MDEYEEEMRQKNQQLRKHVNHATNNMVNQVAGAFMLPWPRKPVGQHAGAKAPPKGARKSSKTQSRPKSTTKPKAWPFGGW